MNKQRIDLLKDFLKENKLKCNNLELLDIALTHSSYTHENNLKEYADYERLEFLGDAVLKLVMSDYLFHIFPEYDEGNLSKIRSIIVSDAILAGFAKKIKLYNYLNIGANEEKQGGRMRESILACAFEAMLGAIYLDGKMDKLFPFLINLAIDEVALIDQNQTFCNPKAVLQEFTQEKYKILPIYELLEEKGPSHDKLFCVKVLIKDQDIGYGEGKSKKEAQQNAASDAISKLGILEDE